LAVIEHIRLNDQKSQLTRLRARAIVTAARIRFGTYDTRSDVTFNGSLFGLRMLTPPVPAILAAGVISRHALDLSAVQ
jgi:hypothetical protein